MVSVDFRCVSDVIGQCGTASDVAGMLYLYPFIRPSARDTVNGVILFGIKLQ